MVAAGDITYASDVNNFPMFEVGYHIRTTPKTGVTTESSVIRIDNIPIRAGYAYMIVLPTVNFSVSAVGPVVRGNIRVSESGAASTASTLVGYGRTSQQDSSSFTDVKPVMGRYTAAATGNLSVLFSVVRAALITGTGTVGVFAGASEPLEMSVYEMSVAATDTGIDL